MIRDFDVPKVARMVAEAFTIGHLITVNALFALGELTPIFSFIQGPYQSVAARHPGVLFVMNSLDQPVFSLVERWMLGTNDTVVFFAWAEFVALGASGLYGILCWFCARMFLGIFRV